MLTGFVVGFTRAIGSGPGAHVERYDRPPDRQFVGVFPVNDRGAVLLQLRDDRPGLDGAGTWSTIGGRIEGDETSEEAARRELREECGRDDGVLVPFDMVERTRTDIDIRYRFYTFGMAVDWPLAGVIVGEGQGFAWWPRAAFDSLTLNPLIVRDMLAFARSPLTATLAASAPPGGPELAVTVPPGFAATLGARPGVLMHIEGVDAALALALRLNLPSGARLTAFPAAGERPDLVIWRPRSATGPAVERLAALSARLPAGSRLWLVTPAPVPARLRPLWTAAAALRLAFGGTVPFPEGMEGARFVRRGGAVR